MLKKDFFLGLKGLFLLLLGFIRFGVSSAKILFSPEYADPRFEPSDAYHAGCLNVMDLSFDAKDVKNIKQMYLVLNYDADALQIVQLQGEYQGKYTVGADKIVLDFDMSLSSSEGTETDTRFAHIQFKSKKGISSGAFIVDDNSYYITDKGEKIFLTTMKHFDAVYNFSFVTVPECEPDIISPSIKLVSPHDGATGQALDTYFVFDIQDEGKGINKDSLSIKLNDTLYEVNNKDDKNMFKRSGSSLLFFPNVWLPLHEEVHLKLRIADLQKYGGPNRAEESFTISTADQVLLNSEVNPNMIRLFKQKTQELFASKSECLILNQLYYKSSLYTRYKLRGVMHKLQCRIDTHDMVSKLSGNIASHSLSGTNLSSTISSKNNPSKRKYFSVFAVLGWILFVVTLLLKLHYLHSSMKYKKHSKNLSKIGRSFVGF